MRTRLLSGGFGLAMIFGGIGGGFALDTGTASAVHEHFLVTPGTCVENIARGQTAIAPDENGGFHRFHVNVHQGVGGTGGPLNKDGVSPVVVDKTDGGDPENLAACAAALE